MHLRHEKLQCRWWSPLNTRINFCCGQLSCKWIYRDCILTLKFTFDFGWKTMNAIALFCSCCNFRRASDWNKINSRILNYPLMTLKFNFISSNLTGIPLLNCEHWTLRMDDMLNFRIFDGFPLRRPIRSHKLRLVYMVKINSTKNFDRNSFFKTFFSYFFQRKYNMFQQYGSVHATISCTLLFTLRLFHMNWRFAAVKTV